MVETIITKPPKIRPVLVYGTIKQEEREYGDRRSLRIDNTTHSLITISNHDHELMRGNIFLYSWYEELAASQIKNVYIETPASPSTAEYYFKWKVSSGAAFSVNFWSGASPETEGVIPSAGIINKRSNSIITNPITLKIDGSIGSGSRGNYYTRYYCELGRRSGGVVEGDAIIIGSGTKIWAEIKNEAAQAYVLDYALEWREQTPRDIPV